MSLSIEEENMSNKTYDRLKVTALILTPVLAFLASLVNIWGLPYGEQIVATLTAIDTLIGAIVVASNNAYNNKLQPPDDPDLPEE